MASNKLVHIGHIIQATASEITWKEFYLTVHQIAKSVGQEYWNCSKSKMISASPKREGLGIAKISESYHWIASVGSVSVNKPSGRECVLMLIANLVAEKQIK